MSRTRKSYGKGKQKIIAPVHNRTKRWCKWCHPDIEDGVVYNHGCLSHVSRKRGGKGGNNGNYRLRNKPDKSNKYYFNACSQQVWELTSSQ